MTTGMSSKPPSTDWQPHRVTLGCNPPANTKYCPDRPVTRGQMAAFLVRALGYTNDGGGNHFSDDNRSVFESAIDRLATAGVTLGCNPPANTKFCPDQPVTRGQMAAFLTRALDLELDPGLPAPLSEVQTLGSREEHYSTTRRERSARFNSSTAVGPQATMSSILTPNRPGR